MLERFFAQVRRSLARLNTLRTTPAPQEKLKLEDTSRSATPAEPEAVRRVTQSAAFKASTREFKPLRDIRLALSDPATLRRTIVLKEILDKPVALRQRRRAGLR